jgi:hypothetical protein
MTIRLTDARANVHLDLTMSTEADVDALIAAVRAETLREVERELERSRDAHNAAIRERDAARKSIAEEEARADAIATHRDAYRAQLATAKREAFVAGSEWYHSPKMDVHAEARSRYPATPSGERHMEDCALNQGTHEAACDCRATPSPEAREVPSEVDIEAWGKDRDGRDVLVNVRITPEVAKRIVRLAQEAE